MFREVETIHVGTLVGVEDPLTHLVAIDDRTRGVLDVVPLGFAAVGVAEKDGIGFGDVVGGWVGRACLLASRPGSPVYQW